MPIIVGLLAFGQQTQSEFLMEFDAEEAVRVVTMLKAERRFPQPHYPVIGSPIQPWKPEAPPVPGLRESQAETFCIPVSTSAASSTQGGSYSVQSVPSMQRPVVVDIDQRKTDAFAVLRSQLAMVVVLGRGVDLERDAAIGKSFLATRATTRCACDIQPVFHCSAFITADEVLYTARHCITELPRTISGLKNASLPVEEAWIGQLTNGQPTSCEGSKLRFIRSGDLDTEDEIIRIPEERVAGCKTVTAVAADIVRVELAIKDGETWADGTGIPLIDPATTKVGSQIAVAGYPGSKALALSYGKKIDSTHCGKALDAMASGDQQTEFGCHSASTMVGSSGSPMIALSEGVPVGVIGFNSGAFDTVLYRQCAAAGEDPAETTCPDFTVEPYETLPALPKPGDDRYNLFALTPISEVAASRANP